MGRMMIASLVLFAVGGPAMAELNADTIKHSQWATNYDALGGGRVRATLTFHGSGGTYETAGGTGVLSNVQYNVRVGGGATITGTWTFGHTRGTFIFFVAGSASPPTFSGSWTANGRSGTWAGRFNGVH